MATRTKKAEVAEAAEPEELAAAEDEESAETVPDPEELVDFYRPPLPYEDANQDMILGINGETIGYKRGNHVKMKRKFVKLVEQNEQEQLAAMMKRKKMQDEFESIKTTVGV